MLLYSPPISTVSLKSKVSPIWVWFSPSGMSLALINGFSLEPKTSVSNEVPAVTTSFP